MAARISRHGGNGLDAWPGYVDALSTLLMVIIFVLLVFVLAQAFLTVTLSGRSHQLDKANQQLAALADELSLERGKSAELQLSVSQLGKELSERSAERDRLARQFADANLAIQAATVANSRLQSQLTDTSGRADAATATNWPMPSGSSARCRSRSPRSIMTSWSARRRCRRNYPIWQRWRTSRGRWRRCATIWNGKLRTPPRKP